MTGPETRPNSATRDAERDEARAQHDADRAPTKDEEDAAERNALDPETSEHFEEMAERGANQKGEGRVP